MNERKEIKLPLGNLKHFIIAIIKDASRAEIINYCKALNIDIEYDEKTDQFIIKSH
jgi:hypothetical protein